MILPDPPHPSLVREVQQKIANGWAFTVQGTILHGEGPNGEGLSIRIGSEAGSQALLDAALAVE